MEHSISTESGINSFAELGNIMGKIAASYEEPDPGLNIEYPELMESLQLASQLNPWFTPSSIAFALKAWATVLNHKSLSHWLTEYRLSIQNIESKRIAVVMAGNIPLVGFHDFMCTLLAGHTFKGKLSSDDKVLLPAFANLLCKINPGYKNKIQFINGTLTDFDAIIATGSNNTARYFEYYFAKYPHIIRKNRNGVAVLTGDESEDDFRNLGLDICTYFGLGCRNVSKIFIPEKFDPRKLFIAIEPFINLFSDHYKYMNNHNFHSSVYLLNKIQHYDNGSFILTESADYSSPISVLYYSFYKNTTELRVKLSEDKESIQCIATKAFAGNNAVHLGYTQLPELNEYADGIDTLNFLCGL